MSAGTGRGVAGRAPDPAGVSGGEPGLLGQRQREHAVERRDQVGGGSEAAVAVLVEHAQQHRGERLRDAEVRPQLVGRGREGLEMVQDDAHRGVRLEGQAAGHHLVQDDPERVQVGPPVELVPPPARGPARGRCTAACPPPPRCAWRRGRPRRRSPPSPSRSRSRGPWPIRRTPSPVSRTLSGLMSRWMMPSWCAAARAEAIWRAMVSAAPQPERPFPADDLAQVGALDVLHDDERPAVLRGVEVVDAHRVRVLEAPRHHRLVAEAAQEVLVVGEPPRDDLDRADLVEGQVPRAVHAGHPARPDLVEDLVLAAQHHARLELGSASEAPPGPWGRCGTRWERRNGRPDSNARARRRL